MKKLNVAASFLVMISLFSLIACKKDDPQPKAERIKALLEANTWIIQTVTVDEVDKTSLFTGLTLSFTNSNYTTTHGGVVWPANGTWAFTDATANTIMRDDGLPITINEISDTTLKLALTWSTTTLGSGRTSSLAGDHEFIFIKD